MMRYLEDFEAGQKFGSGRLCVETARIKSFAIEFDPQPFHLDEDSARDSLFKGLAASGWHTAALTMRLLVQSELKPAGGIIGAGFDEIRWPRPRTAGRRVACGKRSTRSTTFEVATRSGRDQGEDHDVESERAAGTDVCRQSDRAPPSSFFRKGRGLSSG